MTDEAASPYPEHDKMKKVSDESQAIGQFLDLNDHGWILAEYVEIEGRSYPALVPVSLSIQQILALYFDIDLNKIEEERRAMLEALGNQS